MRNVLNPPILNILYDRRHAYTEALMPEEYRNNPQTPREEPSAEPLKLIAVSVTSFPEPTLEAAVRHSHHAIPNRSLTRPCTTEEISKLTIDLLRLAAASGINLTIDNAGNPALGMGGYVPHVKVRPDYSTVRATMTEIKRREQEALEPVTIHATDQGYVRDMDTKSFSHPITRGYVEGIRTLHDKIVGKVE